jgi:hypothetical protein
MARASLCSRDGVFASAITAQSSLSPRDASLPRCRCRVANWSAARDRLCRLQAKLVWMGLVFGGRSPVAGDVVKMNVSPFERWVCLVFGGGVARLELGRALGNGGVDTAVDAASESNLARPKLHNQPKQVEALATCRQGGVSI